MELDLFKLLDSIFFVESALIHIILKSIEFLQSDPLLYLVFCEF